MECTQRLECTQQESFNQTQRECPEQVGFLGICGDKYPVKKGPNKIGRDPQTCNIVLNLNSVSRQHAVINILSKTEFMLMDLDSANKTKLLGKPLLPYMPHPLKNGDLVQFGEVFGIFRLLEEEDELPMTQALPMTQVINVPDTPIPTRHISKLNSATVPESPDVSDKDDSFIIASQTKGPLYKNSHTNFIKPGKTISIQPVGGNKIDNVFWNSSKKSTSLNLDDSNNSLNDTPSKLNEKENEANASNIHEIDTQAFPTDPIHEISTQVVRVKDTDIHNVDTQRVKTPIPDSIYTANTQLPGHISSPSIYTANTQLPGSNTASPSIYTASTQLPETFHSPSIHNLDTQVPPGDLPDVCKINEQQNMQFDICAEKNHLNDETRTHKSSSRTSKNNSPLSKKSDEIIKLNKSDEVVVFDSQQEEDNFESQTLLTEDLFQPINKCVDEPEILSQIALPKSSKRNMRIKSDSSTDCEDNDDEILLTQKIPVLEKNTNDDDTTDCEDDMIELKIDKKPNNTADALDLEDVATQVIEVLEPSPSKNENFEDMLTQVIEVVPNSKDYQTKLPVTAHTVSNESTVSPFKVPFKTAFKVKKKEASKTPKIKLLENVEIKPKIDENEKYYQDTQDIYEDLCSQKESYEVPNSSKSLGITGRETKMLPNNVSDSDIEENINNFVSSLSSQDVRDVIGTEKVTPLSRVSSLGSESSDPEATPKKNRSFKFMDIDLPDSQEIKTTVSLYTKTVITESSSESESEQNSESQCTPILFRKKKRSKPDAKIDLSKRFEVESLPTRLITRVRKPTAKVQDEEAKKITESILKPKFLTEQDDDVDGDIISENIMRLKNEKLKNTSKVVKIDETKISDLTKDENETVLESTKTLDKSKKPDESLKSRKEKLEKAETKRLEVKEETTKIKESKRKKKSSSPVIESKNETNVFAKPNIEKDNNTINEAGDVDISKRIENKTKTRESKRNKTSTIKGKEEKPRGPIMIEPHTITAPVKEEKPKKREYKRKNKEATSNNKLEDHKFTVEPKPAKSKDETVVVETARPIRSTRGRKKISDDFVDPTKSDSQTEKPKRAMKDKDPEQEVRRSRRQRTVKEDPKKEDKVKEKEPVKSILKKTSMHEQSTVYNLSSGSNSDSPANLKRPSEFEDPKPKRTRSSTNANLRATPSRTQKTCYVLFTAFPFEEVKSKLEELGAVVVSDVMQCTVVLTQQIRRTFKLLCAVGLGKPIVGPAWVQACSDTNMIVDPWLYTIKDEVAEKRFRFSLERTLTSRRHFLKGQNVSATPNVMPQASEMKLIVQCSGGNWREGGARWLCLTCAADRELWPELRRRGATLVTTELILAGVLQQRLDVQANTVKAQ